MFLDIQTKGQSFTHPYFNFPVSELAYGNVITLKNTNLAGIYLHSHNFTYPQHKVGKNKQQLTGFGAKDVNNYL